MRTNLSTSDQLSRVLLQKQLVSVAILEEMQKKSRLFQQTLFQIIIQHHLINAEKLAVACADYFQSQTKSSNTLHFEQLCFEKIPFEFIKNHFLLPCAIDNKKCVIAISNPDDRDSANTLAFHLKLPIKMVWAPYDLIVRYHNRYMSDTIYQLSTLSAKTIAEQILSDAIHRSASDIHLEPYQHFFRVRFRLDGLLHTIVELATSLSDGILSCLKVLAQLDIAIKRMPQDGKLIFRSYLGFYKDCRVSTCPTALGEKMVIRLLDQHTNTRGINELGLSLHQEKIILRAIQKPQGLILVTGPTGSGKTITLYTLLQLLNQTHRNIVTIEDPIEMQIEGVNQTHINIKTGLTFAHTLRALLRQDPDVIMIGEIRDAETAEMAIRAAQTGHLVLSTLHTNSAAEAITRLTHMGIARFHLSAALSLVIAQRLVRKHCVHCLSEQHHNCSQCHEGFSGRLGIFELLPVDETVQQCVLAQAPLSEIIGYNKNQGNNHLSESAMEAVLTGKTSLAEIQRVIC